MKTIINTFVAIPEGPPKTTKQAQLQGRLKNGMNVRYKTERLILAENMLYLLFRPCKLPIPLVGACKVIIRYTWPWQTGHSKKIRARGWIYKTTKPDWDNSSKLFCDAINIQKGFFKDDAIIADGRLIKGFGDKPGIHFKLIDLEQ